MAHHESFESEGTVELSSEPTIEAALMAHRDPSEREGTLEQSLIPSSEVAHMAHHKPSEHEGTLEESLEPSSEADPKSERNHHHPVDTGWSFVILLAVFSVNVISVGFLRTLGVLLVAIQSTFLSSASMVSLIGGVVSAVFSVTAVLCMSVLLEVMSVRRCTLIGALVGTCGLVTSFYATSVITLIFSFSACLGIGLGMSMAPGYILLNVYFRRKLPLAIALANTGSSIGSIVMPMATRMLLDKYFLSGTLLLLGGVYAQILVFGALFTPPSEYGEGDDDQQSQPDSRSSHEGTDMEWEQLRPSQAKEGSRTPSRQRSGSESLVSDRTSNEPLTKSLPTIHGLRFYQPMMAKWRHSWREILPMETLVRAGSMTHHYFASLSQLNTRISLKEVGAQSSLINNQVETSLPQSDEDNSQESDSDGSDHSRLSACKRCSICDPSLYTSPVFFLLVCYHFVGSLVCSLPAAYLPALAQEKGLTLIQGALLLTICGFLDIVSRLVPGILAQSGLVKPRTSVAVSMLVLGVTLQMAAVVDGMTGLVVMSVVYGLFSGVFFSMLQVIILDVSGLDKFRHVFSFTQIALGASEVCGYLVVGYLRDVTGSYVTSFHFMGICAFLASTLLLVVMPAVQRRERARRGPSCVGCCY